MIDKDSLPLDKPRRTPDHPTKSHVVKTRVDGKEKIIRFGEQGASTAGKPKAGESDRMKQKRASFKARHAKNIAKGKSSPAYWANKVKWKTGGAVGLEELDEKYEGIKKPDFALLDSFKDLIRTLQSKAADANEQEFDAVRALGRSGAGSSLEDLYETYTGETVPHAARAEAKGNVNPDRAKSAKMVFDSFKNAGFSDAQARALTAEINRENVFNPKYLYGTHTDAANRATNVGMLSWQGDRANRLLSFMADRGLVDAAGGILPGQDALNAQAEYLRWEMENDPSYAKTRETFLSNPDIDSATAHDILGKNFIRWRIDDPEYRGSGFNRINEGYDILNMAQGYAEGGEVKKDELAEAERLRDLQLMAEERNPNAVAPRKPSIADLPGGISERLALLNEYLNPVEAIGGAMRAGSRLTSDDASGYERLAALGNMLSGVAGVAGPAAAAKRVGTPAAAAVVEALTGASPATQEIADMARKYAVDESGALRMYHGSPHDFDKFELSPRTLGTGEGAQAYGRGLYFAENEAVAQVYRDDLVSAPNIFKIKGGDRAAAIDQTRSNLKNIDARIAEVMQKPDTPNRRATLAMWEAQKAKNADALQQLEQNETFGRIYEVNVNANPEDFLDWDLPMSKQPQAVQDALAPMVQSRLDTLEAAGQRGRQIAAEKGLPDFTPKSRDRLYEEMRGGDIVGASNLGQFGQRAEELLSNAGVPGIRFLDAGSRGAGDGTRNYVIFDDRLINIVRKYGIAGAAAALGVSQADVAQAMQQGGASQYDPDAIEARASKAGKNEFAAGGAVKYDPAAVDSIINKLREVNRG